MIAAMKPAITAAAHTTVVATATSAAMENDCPAKGRTRHRVPDAHERRHASV
jgi:hypothetical protein